MIFQVTNTRPRQTDSASFVAYLVRDNWDDFGFKTAFIVVISHPDSGFLRLGPVKIATRAMSSGYTEIDRSFDHLDDKYFSLGQTDDYYAELQKLPDEDRKNYLEAIRDVAFNSDLLIEFSSEKALDTSLLRQVPRETVSTQFYRMAHGGHRHEQFSFRYESGDAADLSLTFNVAPATSPPTNIHVIIGRNGVGKTRLLGRFEDLAAKEDAAIETSESLHFTESQDGTTQFWNLVTIAFSAFDSFHEEFSEQSDFPFPARRTRHVYFGLKQAAVPNDTSTEADEPNDNEIPRNTHKSTEDIVVEYRNLLKVIARSGRKQFADAVGILNSDPLINSSRLSTELSSPSDNWHLLNHIVDPVLDELVEEFRSMSSGHKIILFSLAGLAAKVNEKTLVLIDEPETHLHPPLLSAFIRAVSNLLIERNGVAVIATHSPVVLQEVPNSCVWKLSRFGGAVKAERPAIETFGENVGTLTSEVFGLEVERSGFFKLLESMVEQQYDYEDVIGALSGQLGAEGKAMLRVLLANRSNR